MAARSVLVVDDDEVTTKTIQGILEREGMQVRVARNAVQALALAEVARPDVVLLDLMMPVVGGWDLVRRLRATPDLADVPLVVISAMADVEREAARLGVEYFLRKPFALDDLLGAVRVALQSAKK